MSTLVKSRSRRTPMLFGIVLALLLMVLAAGSLLADDHDDGSVERALYDRQGRMVGTVTLTDGDSALEVAVQLAGMNPVAGDRTIALTERGECNLDDAFASAGEHVTMLSNIQFYAAGNADYKTTTDGKLADLFDADGTGLVIYDDVGEQATERIACAVVAAATVDAVTDTAGDVPAASGDVPAAAAEVDDEVEEVIEEVVEAMPVDDADEMEEVAEERTVEQAFEEGIAGYFYDKQGRIVGTFLGVTDNDEVLGLGIYIEGMDAVAGNRRVAVRESAVCDAPDFASTGAEIYDLGNVQMYAGGQVDAIVEEAGIADVRPWLGGALVIYDDEGEEGDDIIACGPIAPAPDVFEGAGITVIFIE